MPFPNFLDSSMISEFRACPRKFAWHYLRTLVPRGKASWHLHAGGAYAHALDTARRAWAEGLEDWQERGLEALIRAYGPEDSDIEAKSLDRIAHSYALYWHHFPIDQSPTLQRSGGKPMTEFTFSLPLPIDHPETGDPILYCGRFDWVANYRDTLWVADDKTCTSLGQTWAQRWPLRSQLMGYVYAARAHGLEVSGALVRGCAMTTTPTFAQVMIPFPDWKLARWYTNLLATIENILWHYERDHFPEVFDDPCIAYGGCEYQSLCTTKDPTAWLSQFEERAWDPLEKVKEQTL